MNVPHAFIWFHMVWGVCARCTGAVVLPNSKLWKELCLDDLCTVHHKLSWSYVLVEGSRSMSWDRNQCTHIIPITWPNLARSFRILPFYILVGGWLSPWSIWSWSNKYHFVVNSTVDRLSPVIRIWNSHHLRAVNRRWVPPQCSFEQVIFSQASAQKKKIHLEPLSSLFSARFHDLPPLSTGFPSSAESATRLRGLLWWSTLLAHVALHSSLWEYAPPCNSTSALHQGPGPLLTCIISLWQLPLLEPPSHCTFIQPTSTFNRHLKGPTFHPAFEWHWAWRRGSITFICIKYFACYKLIIIRL